MTVLVYIQSHLLLQQTQYLQWERVRWCVVWWGIIFTAFSSSLIRSGDIQQLAGESDRTRKGDEWSTRGSGKRQRQKSKDKKKRGWLVIDHPSPWKQKNTVTCLCPESYDGPHLASHYHKNLALWVDSSCCMCHTLNMYSLCLIAANIAAKHGRAHPHKHIVSHYRMCKKGQEATELKAHLLL